MTALVAVVEPVVSDLDVALRIVVALLLGGLIGMEREVSNQPAGLRTHIAVALGAALFGIISVHGFDAYVQPRADSNYQVDVTRVASQVVVAVGFLGGGAILKHGGTVSGLTTAASLWVTCAVGLAAGVGSMVAATITTFALFLSLVGLRAPRERIRRTLARARGSVLIEMVPDADPSEMLTALLALEDVTVKDLSVSHRGDTVRIRADIAGPVGSELAAVLAPISDRDDVAEIDID
ncbi:MAG TPA: MgtC/SapB family protein [Acidimicrobiales bacterium]